MPSTKSPPSTPKSSTVAAGATRPWTSEEMKDEFLRLLIGLADEWARYPDKSPRERCRGLAFSILATIDGDSIAMPAIDLVLRPHEEDKEYHQEQGENWIEPGTVINADAVLHEEWHGFEKRADK